MMSRRIAGKNTEVPLIIQYTNLLHRHRNPDAKSLRDFRKAHKDNDVFLKRARALNKVWRLKESLLD